MFRVYHKAELPAPQSTKKGGAREFAASGADSGEPRNERRILRTMRWPAIHVLSVGNECTRECLGPEVDASFASRPVTRSKEGETAGDSVLRAEVHRSGIFWRRASSQESSRCKSDRDAAAERYVESFNGKLRDECLNVKWFENLWDARRKIAAWQNEFV